MTKQVVVCGNIYVYLIAVLCVYFVKGAQDELSGLVVIFRHGDRTPINPYKNDPYRNASYWPVGFGQLTNIGKEQHLQLGKWLRNRYQKYLPDLYSENDIRIRSTDIDRTLMSAEANLAGLYPPRGPQEWDKSIYWQPIPVHTVPESADCVLSAKKYCPTYEKLTKDLFRSPFFRNISHQLHDLYGYLSRYSGEKINTLENLEFLYNTLFIETLYNYTLPDWAQKVFPGKLEKWAYLSFTTQTYTPQMARLKVGPFFDYIINYFKNRTLPTTTSPKALIFSAHDTNIANILNSMGAFENHSPPYAATILFELRKASDGNSYLNIFYKNSSEAREINLKTCDFNCDIEDFISILKPITVSVDDWSHECRLKWVSNWPLSFETNVILICVLIGVVLLSTAILVGLKQGKKENELDYVQLPNEEYA